MPAIIFDLATAIFIYKVASKKLNYRSSLLCALAYVLNPAVIYDSAIWGQVDSVYTFFALLAIYFLTENKYLFAFTSFTFGVLIKPQCLILSPIFIYALYKLLKKDNFSKKTFYLVSQYCLCCVLIFIALQIPFTKNFDFMPLINQYRETFASYPYATINAFNLYMYAGLNWFKIDQSWAFDLIELVLVLAITIFVFWFLFKSRSKAKYFFAAALLDICVYMFTFKMHERYIFPVISMLLVAFIYSKVKRNLLSYGGFSITCFINCFAVVSLLISKNNNAFSVMAQVFSIVNLILAFIAIYTAIKNYVQENDTENLNQTIKQPNRFFKIKPAEEICATEKLASIKKNDWLIIFVITILYACVAFFNLGNTESPESFWLGNKSDTVIIKFEKPSSVSRMQVLNGIRPDKKLDIYSSVDKTDWNFEKQIDISGVSSVFTWREDKLDIKSAQFIKIVFETDETYIQEIAFRDSKDKILPARIIDGNALQLIDEQDLVPEYSDYMNSMYFDEVYHARTGYEFLHRLKVYETTHPPLGKDFIALGIKLFGMTPFGWRFSGTLAGVLMLPVFYILSKRIFSRTLWATFSTLLFAFEFMHFEQTRIATVDSYTVLFILLMYLAMLKYYKTNFFDTKFFDIIKPLALCAVFSGLACASKWQGFYAMAGLAVLFIAVIFMRYKEFLFAKKCGNETIINKFQPLCYTSINFSLILIFIITIPIYLMSYFLYLKTPNVYGLASVAKNQDYMFGYHAYLEATHAFSSKWWQWILNLRPILFYKHSYSENIRAGISCFANPAICYGGLVGFFYCIAKISRKFDKNIFFMLVGYAAQLLPWVFISRLTFAYHYFPCIPFLILLFTYFIKDYLYPRFGNKVLISTLVLTALLFVMFYPVLSGMPVNVTYINRFLKWFDSWQLT